MQATHCTALLLALQPFCVAVLVFASMQGDVFYATRWCHSGWRFDATDMSSCVRLENGLTAAYGWRMSAPCSQSKAGYFSSQTLCPELAEIQISSFRRKVAGYRTKCASANSRIAGTGSAVPKVSAFAEEISAGLCSPSSHTGVNGPSVVGIQRLLRRLACTVYPVPLPGGAVTFRFVTARGNPKTRGQAHFLSSNRSMLKDQACPCWHSTPASRSLSPSNALGMMP